MQFYTDTELGPRQALLPSGALLCQDVTLARTGTQYYHPSEIGLDGADMIAVQRDAEEVFAPRAPGGCWASAQAGETLAGGARTGCSPHLLAELEKRCAEQRKCGEEKHGSTPYVLEPEESEQKSHDNKQRRAYSAGKRQARCAAEEADPPLQARNV